MVKELHSVYIDFYSFQYSLCRVVLMVTSEKSPAMRQHPLSVLALSSRFDGRTAADRSKDVDQLSVLALSSRFDGHLEYLRLERNKLSFSTRSVESF